jgi:uncharacterized protein (DUF924 family)
MSLPSKAASAAQAPWAKSVLSFWFGTLKQADWFEFSPHLDADIKTRFLPLYTELKASPPAESWTDAQTALANIIVFDQFPRHMFRKQAEAFATDAEALSIAKNAVDKGLDKALSLPEALFLYIPFEHSENLADQDTFLRLCEAAGAPQEALKFGQLHRDIIVQFGRFPHRNKCLGRTNTPEEVVWCAKNHGFGQ